MTSSTAARELRLWPWVLRPIVHWFLPSCRRLRALARETQHIIAPVLPKRRAEKAKHTVAGKDPVEYNGPIQWMEQAARGRQYLASMTPLVFFGHCEPYDH
jgi:hypothetical protein